jgi:protein SCO1
VNLRRGLLWGLLVAALLAVTAAALVQRWRRPEPPPVLGRVPPFALTNRDGRRVALAGLAGAPWVADFIFTHCAASCPMMTARMARLERELPRRLGARFVSFTVDPDRDTPPVLARYAESFAAPARWLFLTGGRDELHRLSRDGFKLAVDAASPGPANAEEPILHSTRFVLVDRHGAIRGYYDGLDEESMKKLWRDLEAVAGER